MKTLWKVNVIQQVDHWLLISEESLEKAEAEAAHRPGVVRVVKGHTIRADRPIDLYRQGGEE